MNKVDCLLLAAPPDVAAPFATRPGVGTTAWRDTSGAVPATTDATARAATGLVAPGTPAPAENLKTRSRARRRGKGHRPHMPRERLLDAGPATLSDVELIALLLGTGLPGHDVFGVARGLLERFSSLRGLLDATPADFRGLRGIGPAKTAKLLAIVETARRALVEKMRERPLIDSPGAVEDYLRLLIGSRPYEVFVCLFLDARHRLLRSEENSRGSITRMAVYPREIVRRALELNAASLIVAHNHPSGAVQPSASDRRLTRMLRETLTLIDVQLLDHLVVGAHETFSFARAGWS